MDEDESKVLHFDIVAPHIFSNFHFFFFFFYYDCKIDAPSSRTSATKKTTHGYNQEMIRSTQRVRSQCTSATIMQTTLGFVRSFPSTLVCHGGGQLISPVYEKPPRRGGIAIVGRTRRRERYIVIKRDEKIFLRRKTRKAKKTERNIASIQHSSYRGGVVSLAGFSLSFSFCSFSRLAARM